MRLARYGILDSDARYWARVIYDGPERRSPTRRNDEISDLRHEFERFRDHEYANFVSSTNTSLRQNETEKTNLREELKSAYNRIVRSNETIARANMIIANRLTELTYWVVFATFAAITGVGLSALAFMK